ncbi:MAG: metalloregulator ArsR/SmtB family transcription factor [Planctomycetota bacterium]
MPELAPDLALKALADRQRLRLTHALLGGELCVGDLVTLVEAPQPTVSRNLAILRRAGWIEVRRAGAFAFYRLAPAGDGFRDGVLEGLARAARGDRELARDRKRAERMRAGGGCCPGAAKAPGNGTEG